MKPIYSGKVREIYDISDDRLVIVTTDRISAFDHILPQTVRNKGIILNKLSNFWFKKTEDTAPNHIISENPKDMPKFFQKEEFKDRTALVKKLQMLPFEFVVRGYMFGNMWSAYQKGIEFCGLRLPPGYREAQKLETPVLTPALKRDTGHDAYIELSNLENQLGKETTRRITNTCFQLYDTCAKYALSRGIIIADTKFEFGIDKDGTLTLADELFTPDSSRFWDLLEYSVGTSPRSYDKQLLRDWLTAHTENGVIPFDSVPENIIHDTEAIYRKCLLQLTHKVSS